MTNVNGRIRDDVELRCPHCNRWHPIERPVVASDHAYVQTMRYFTCEGHRYFAGAIGTWTPHALRARPS